jgi:hypothetical protein
MNPTGEPISAAAEDAALVELLGAVRVAANRLDPSSPWGGACREIDQGISSTLGRRRTRPASRTPLHLVDCSPPEPDEYTAAAVIAETLREQAANMAPDSELGGLVRRSAVRWADIAGTRPLSLTPPPEIAALAHRDDGEEEPSDGRDQR